MGKNGKRLKLCIVSHFAYGALKGGRTGHIGGVENQTALMAKWFAAQGHEVSMLTWDEGQPEDEIVDGVRVIKICRREAGLPGLRFFTPRWSGLNRAMARADADIYYQNCAEYVTGQVALWCRRNGRKFIYSVASDPDCDPRLPVMKTLRERVLYRYGLRHADRVIVQNERQQRMLREGFGIDATIMPMACRGAHENELADPPFDGKRAHRIIWVGRIAPVKRAEVLLDLARHLPRLEFDLVGGKDQDPAYFERIMALADELPNITAHGRLSRKEIDPLYKRASLLCCTSKFEGFPNTFLEAWSFGLPIVSTVDPDGLVSGGLGRIGNGTDALAGAIEELLQEESRWREISTRCRSYFMNHHDADSVMRRYEALMHETLEEGKR